MNSPLEPFADIGYYTRYFTDASFWSPYVRQVCLHHHLSPDLPIRGGIPGTFPVFIVADRWVVKFFGPLFDGGAAFQAEKSVNALLGNLPDLPAPALVAEGRLIEDGAGWDWPYLVSTFIPGVSYGEVVEQLSLQAKLDMAQQLGGWVRQLHNLTASDLFRQQQGCFQPYAAFLRERRALCVADHRHWGDLPTHLIDQIDSYLPGIDTLIPDEEATHLVHADLTRDHILGQLEGDRWQTTGLIDFGDALIGDIYYELVALHLDLFTCDHRLLAAFLVSYGGSLGSQQDFPTRAMSCALLHPFNVFGHLTTDLPAASSAKNLAELAVLLFSI